MAEAGGVEIARAYVALTPSMQGAQGAIAKALVPEAESAGDEAAKATGGRFKGNLTKYLAAGAIVGGAVGAFKGLYAVGSIFDDLSDTIRTTTGATGKNLDGLVGVAENVGRKVPEGFDKIGPVVSDLNQRLGLSGDTLSTVAQQYLAAGRILGQDVDIQKTSKAFSAFGISGKGVSTAMDQLFRVSQSTGVGMNELADAVSKNAPGLKQLGFSFDQTAALAGNLDKAGLNSTATLAGMSKGLVTLAKQGKDPQKAFADITTQINGLVKSGKDGEAINLASGIFGTKAATQFVGAVKTGALSMDDLTKSVGGSKDTILGVADDTADFAEKWGILKNNALLAIKPLGSAVFDTLGSVLSGMLPTLTKISTFLSDNPVILKGLVVTVGALAVAWLAYKGAMAAQSAVTKVWSKATKIAAGVQKAFNVVMAANPMALLVIAIVAVVAALVIFFTKTKTGQAIVKAAWGAIKSAIDAVGKWFTGTLVPAFKKGWDSITGFFSSAKDKVVSVWNGAISWFTTLPGKLVSALSSLVSKLGKPFSDAVAHVIDIAAGIVTWYYSLPVKLVTALASLVSKLGGPFTSAKDKAISIFGAVVTWFTGLPGRLASGASAIASKVGAKFTSAKDKAISIFGAVVSWFTGLPGRVASGLGTLASKVGAKFTSAKNHATDIFGGIVSWFKDLPGRVVRGWANIGETLSKPFKTAFNKIAGFWNNSVGKIGFTLPKWVPGIGGKGFNFPKIPLLAEGGVIRSAGWAVVGDAGPELLRLPTGAQVVPNPTTREILTSATTASTPGAPAVARLHPDDIRTLAQAMLAGAERIANGSLTLATKRAVYAEVY